MKIFISIAVLFVALSNTSIAEEIPADSMTLPQLRETISPILKMALLSEDDLRLRDDYLEKDSMRLSLVDSFMADPFYMESYGPITFEKLERDPSLGELVINGAEILSPLSEGFIPKIMLKPILRPHDLSDKEAGLVKFVKNKKDVEKIPENLRSALDIFIYAFANSQNDYNDSFSDSPKDSLIYGLTLMLVDDELNEKKSIEELDGLGEYSEEWAKVLPDLLPRFRMGLMLNGARTLATAIDNIITISKENHFNNAENHQPVELETKWGKIAVGSMHSDSYKGRYILIIDPSGDDVYKFTSSYGGQSTVIIDYGGNDIYRFTNDSLYSFTETAKTLNENPPGIGGYKYLIDYEGNDIYEGCDFSLAAAVLGVSIFKDYNGDDTYLTDTFGPGAGTMGIGILMDFEGRDSYNGAMYNEGYGFTGGLGILFDGEGHDSYTSGGKYGDILRYVDHYITFSQGSAYGLRPYLSGGIGMLLDGSGNDLYVSDIFGQAAGYWYSAGIIYDRSGNDRYNSFQYAQGSGTHMAVGCLRDDAGDDIYFSKGVSQGCGHDYAHGWLVDYAGGDVYSAFDLSQGAGSANGIGVIVDFKGEDRYYVKSGEKSQGYGNPRRSFGSIGLFYDAGGVDRYDGGLGKDGHTWIFSKWGVGYDKPDESTDVK
ncbi:MAG: hypothetical protein GY855_02060 [candidate division Zixibacteria bacterium]|nr:hypothetical protein [candidate division Zixibacteria bacterium]